MLGIAPQANQYASPFDIALHQLEMVIENKADPAQISGLADRILPLVRNPQTGKMQLSQEVTAVLEFQILYSIIDRLGRKPGNDTYLLSAIFYAHFKAGFLSSWCQLSSLAVGMASEGALSRIAHVLENCPPNVLHSVFGTLNHDYLVLCPKTFDAALRNMNKVSKSFCSVLIQGSLLSARQMRLSTFSTDHFNIQWLEMIVRWLSETPAILTSSGTSGAVIVSLSNFIILIETASVIAESDITNVTNSTWTSSVNREELMRLKLIAEKMNSSILLSSFSIQSQDNLTKSPNPQISSVELTGPSFSLLSEAAHLIAVPSRVSFSLDFPIVKLLQQIQALKSAKIIPAISRDELTPFCSQFKPISASKLVELIV